MDFLNKIYEKIKGVYGPRHFAALVLLLLIISVVGLAVGMKYSRYIRTQPEYCNSCHLMQEAFDGWRASRHKTVSCQQCHRLGLVEQNMLLVKYVVYGPEKVPQKHGKKLPWEGCAGCHWEQESQGREGSEESYGHYRHHFLECFNCHPFKDHDFPVDGRACSKCHRDKRVHGSGMEEIPCVGCHIFSLREGTEKNRVVPSRERCMKCHEDALKEAFPHSAPMARLECFDCHDPHGEIVPGDKICVDCHKNDIQDKGHRAHKSALCGKCHKAHTWHAGGAACGSCHAYRDPAVFK